MRPPICAVCHKDFRTGGEGGLVSFALSEADKEFNKRFDQPGFTGHPKGLEWFCEEHYKKAEELKKLTYSEAIKLIK